MNVLVLQPGFEKTHYAMLVSNRDEAVLQGQLALAADSVGADETLAVALRDMREAAANAAPAGQIDVVAVRVIYGGEAFTKAVMVDESVVARLAKLACEAPLHVPAAVTLLQACASVFTHVPVLAVFETAFFAALPRREQAYALGESAGSEQNARRYGYEGVYHAAACAEARRQLRAAGKKPPAKVVSICLERQIEISAVAGQRPLTVTRGATPLEGVPGETTCGQIDPAIVLTLAEKKGWGPEQINRVLTRQSGILALTGKPMTLAELFASQGEAEKLAQEMLLYSLLQACGAAVATLGGLDALVFSGRYVALADTFGEALSKGLGAALASTDKVLCIKMEQSNQQLIAATAAHLVRSTQQQTDQQAG